MKRIIEWSPSAKDQYFNTLEYLNETWGPKVSLSFINRVERVILAIADQPSLFPKTLEKKNVRRVVLTKHSTLYFRERNGKIQIILLFDNRQNRSQLRI